MTDAEVKALVRQRDEYKCVRCGMTNDEHQEKNGKSLDVHRVIPGSYYDVQGCVTLCRACHGKMPKSVDAAYFGEEEQVGVVFMFLMLHLPCHKRIWDALQSEATKRGVSWGQVAGSIFDDWIATVGVDEYVI
jgi:hypothetical protein